MTSETLPRILVIDDLLGRTHPDKANRERANLCGQYLLEDVTGDQHKNPPTLKINSPLALATFCRGQMPACSTVGDQVENSMDVVLATIRQGWSGRKPGDPPWSIVGRAL